MRIDARKRKHAEPPPNQISPGLQDVRDNPFQKGKRNLKWQLFTWAKGYERIACGSFDYFLQAFLYPRKLGVRKATINLLGPSRDLYEAFSKWHWRRKNKYKYTMEERMARYRKTARDKIIEKANARKNQGNGSKALTFKNLPKDMQVEFWKPSKSIHNLDIIGYVLTDEQNPDCDDNLKPGYLWYARNYWVHRNIGTEDDMVICPAKTFGERCPICEYAKQRRASGEASKEELDALKPKQRQLFNVIDRDSGDGAVKLFDCSYHLFGRQLDKEILDAEDEEVADFFEPTNGFTLRVRFDKKSFNGREFYECDRIDFRDRKKQYSEDIIDETYPLDDLLNHMSYDALNELFVMGAELREDDGNSEYRTEQMRTCAENEEREITTRERRSERKRGRPVDDEPDDEPEAPVRGSEDADEPDDAPTPPRRAARRGVEATNDDDPDNEPAKPARGRRRADRGADDEIPFEDKKPARGSRRANRVEPEPEPEDEPEPKKPSRRRNADDDGDDGDKCPHGLKFGKDCDTSDDCDECKKWPACNAANRKQK